jgi:hypothetical protein
VILGPLYHWSPADRYESILAHGLFPGSRATVASVGEARVRAARVRGADRRPGAAGEGVVGWPSTTNPKPALTCLGGAG